MKRLLSAAALLALAACGQKAEAPKAEAPAAAPSLAKASRTISYTCEKDLPITAIHGTNAEGKPDLALIIRGDDFRLTPTDATPGTRYTTEYGLEPGLGLAWWEQPDGTVLLQQSKFKTINDPTTAETLRTCKVKTEPDGAKAAK
ncbi:lysozyme inhibitor [Sandaracinobacter neustonicus]|uniref:Lysozyme inhibitor n=1 Tax=Sandaracinobacter neustonicus TaxID=1715348 RepID=A0A501XF12_9SPHN|nr:lysozyme inhibitor [Sandaracinobacter neustonicus]TPE59228.1 lysozyme inhibitor [Sandaracinobacter neustonicus]